MSGLEHAQGPACQSRELWILDSLAALEKSDRTLMVVDHSARIRKIKIAAAFLPQPLDKLLMFLVELIAATLAMSAPAFS